MADMHAMAPPPFEEFCVVALAGKVGARAIGKVGLRRPVHRMIAGIDPRHRRDRAEFTDCGVGHLRVVDDVGIVAHLDVEQHAAGADLAIGAKPGFLQLCGGVDQRFDRERLAGHSTSRNEFYGLRGCTSSNGLMTMS
jgi:hypothetical protein